MTLRQELLAVPKRKWDEVLHNVGAVYIIPSRRKHDSGYMCMDFVACRMDKSGRITNDKIRFGGGCDVVNLLGLDYANRNFSFDCEEGVLRIFTFSKPFMVTRDLSSVDFSIEEYRGDFNWDDIVTYEVEK